MFEILLNCKPDEILYNMEQLYDSINTKEEAEQLILTIWKRVPKLIE